MNFKSIRIEALKYWLEYTQRIRYINDVTHSTYECDWQNNYVSEKMHSSLFCSLAEWNTHITDLLYDKSLDKYTYSMSKYIAALFRYYSRFLLITSEVLTDFQDLVVYLDSIKQKNARINLSDTNHLFSFDELMKYINSVCKHKIDASSLKKYHNMNHHIDYFYNDSEVQKPVKTINIHNISEVSYSEAKYLEVPRLVDIIYQILYCCQEVNDQLHMNYSKYKAKLLIFEAKE